MESIFPEPRHFLPTLLEEYSFLNAKKKEEEEAVKNIQIIEEEEEEDILFIKGTNEDEKWEIEKEYRYSNEEEYLKNVINIEKVLNHKLICLRQNRKNKMKRDFGLERNGKKIFETFEDETNSIYSFKISKGVKNIQIKNKEEKNEYASSFYIRLTKKISEKSNRDE